MRRISDSV